MAYDCTHCFLSNSLTMVVFTDCDTKFTLSIFAIYKMKTDIANYDTLNFFDDSQLKPGSRQVDLFRIIADKFTHFIQGFRYPGLVLICKRIRSITKNLMLVFAGDRS